MKATPHGLQKALLSLLVPMMVASGVANVPGLVTAKADTVPVTAQAQPDIYRSALSEPGFQTHDRKHRGEIPVQFLGINDLHGNLDTTEDAWIGNVHYPRTGNVSRLAAYLNQAQRQFERVHLSRNTFRLQAGDMVGASPANSSLLAHEPTMHALRAMHFQIGTLGNHEFDHGLPEFNRILTGGRPAADSSSLVKNYPHRATGMQEVVANVVQKYDNQIPYGYKPYTIRTVRALGRTAKVGFIGIETSQLATLTYAKYNEDYKVLDEAETIAKYDKELSRKGVKAVVVMAHTGAKNFKGIEGDSMNILQKVNQLNPNNHIGLYMAAHSHQYSNAMVGKTHVVQAVAKGKAFSDTQGYISPRTGQFTKLEAHVYPVLAKTEDPLLRSNFRVEQIIADANRRVAGRVNAVIGKAATANVISNSQNQNGESPVGELVVDGQLYEARKHGNKVDFAMTNSGGVRSDLVVNAQREITWGAATAVQPFGNVLKVIEMTGQQVVDALQNQYGKEDGTLQIAGLKYTYKSTGKKGHQVLAVTKDDGTPLDMTAKYQVVINDFLHDNSKYKFQGTPIVGTLFSDTDTFVQYIQDMQAAGKAITAPKGDRKIYQSEKKPAKTHKAATTVATGLAAS